MKNNNRMVLIGCLLLLSFSFLFAGRAYHNQKNAVIPAAVTWGSTGSQVREVQERLQQWDYYDGPIDGIFGPATYEAIRLFQERNGLTVDGIAGDATLEALGINIAPGITGLGETGLSAQEEDLYLLASAIYGEARGEPYEGQVAVGAVILNRVASEKFPNSIADVIFQTGAFTAVADGQFFLTPDETALNAARDALSGWDPSDGALYYWNPEKVTSRWIWSVPVIKVIGRHVFGTL